MAFKETVAIAIDQIRKAFPDCGVQVREDGDGGAYVKVETVELGSEFEPTMTWLGFRITFQYPYADCYPHYIRPDLKRAGGGVISGEGIQPGQMFDGEIAIQLSRRSNRLDPQTDTALLKLQKVILWLRSKS